MPFNRFLRLAATTLCALLLLASCAQQPIEKREIPPRPERVSVKAFVLSGRAVITQGTQANTVRVMWEHTWATDTIAFASPLGSTMAELQRNAEGATWTSSEGDTYSARNADTLMTHLTKTPVPLDALALWVTGQVTGGAQGVLRDESGRLRQAFDRDWMVRVLSYETDLPNAMPSSIEARQGGVQIRLAVEDWQL